MQIIFDSRFDGVADAHRMRDMLTAYINSREGISINMTLATTSVPPKGHDAPTGPRNVIQGGVEFDENGEAVAIHQTSLNDPLTRPRSVPAPEVYSPGMAYDPATDRIVDPIVAAVLDPRGPASIGEVISPTSSVSFQPGDMSGSAPSPAVAAPSPTAPEVPQDGVPMPPTVASVPAPPSTAPVAPAAPSTSAESASLAAGGELDVKGLPWDERIHAGTKVKNADGSWRQRRGLNDAALLARVEAELRNTPQATAEHAADKQEPAGWTTPAAAVPPPPVTTVAAPPAPAAPDALTYDGFLSWVTPKMMDGSTPFDKVAAALSASGVSSLQELRDSPAAIPAVYAALGGV